MREISFAIAGLKKEIDQIPVEGSLGTEREGVYVWDKRLREGQKWYSDRENSRNGEDSCVAKLRIRAYKITFLNERRVWTINRASWAKKEGDPRINYKARSCRGCNLGLS